MTRLAHEILVVRLASELGLDWNNPVTAVIDYCKKKIAAWVRKAGPVHTIRDLEQLVCRELHLVFEEVWCDDDLKALVHKYVSMGEYVFAHLPESFDDHTYASLLERQHVDATALDRYVAVVDCRGSKAHRRFFTRWHEIAHLLTLRRQLELPFHRSTIHDPVERVMDVVAGEIGFYEPLFVPVLRNKLSNDDLTFDIVEKVRNAVCPEASFQATLLACVKHIPRPTLYLEAGLGLKKHEQARLSQESLFPIPQPMPKLRALTVILNEPARTTGLRIHQNMRVPEDSLLHYNIGIDTPDREFERSGIEQLGLWTHSDGTRLTNIPVHVQSRRVGDRVIALIRATTA